MYARIVNNIIAEIVDFDPAERFHPDVAALFTPTPEGAGIGYTLVDGVWQAPVIPEPTPITPAPGAVPESITYRQFILGLLTASFITQEEALAAASGTIPASIDAIFDTLPIEDAVKAKITFKTMTSVYRSDPIVSAAGTALGQSSSDIDNFFRLAANL